MNAKNQQRMGKLLSLIVFSFIILLPTQIQAQKCPVPTGLSASAISDQGATLSWDVQDEHLNYDVSVMHGKNTPQYKHNESTPNNSIVLTDLSAGSNYRFKVKASCAKGKGNSKWVEFQTTGSIETGDTVEVVTTNGPCPKVVNMAVLEVSDSSVLLSWRSDVQHVSFQVDVKSKNHTTSFNESNTTTDTFYTVEGLEGGGNYHFRVKASCASKSAGSSKWIDFSTAGGDSLFNNCPKPKNLSVLEVTETTALLNWIHQDSAGTFDLEIKSGSMTPSFSFATTLMVDSFLAEGLSPDGNYQFRVKATCGDGSTSGSSDWAAFKTLLVDRDTVLSDTTTTVIDTSTLAGVDMENRATSQSISQLSVRTENNIEENNASLSVFPNPATASLAIAVQEKYLKKVTVVRLNDMMGKIVLQQKIMDLDGPYSLDINDVKSGYYQLVVKSGNYLAQKMVYISR